MTRAIKRANRPYVELSHDPFARVCLVRKTELTSGGCTWCGGSRYRADKPREALFVYGTERDDRPGRPDWHSGFFCNKSCHDSYHE
jgi:hypothetical protein